MKIRVVQLFLCVYLVALTAYPQSEGQPTNSMPNPYQTVSDWAKLPEGRTWGSTSAVEIDKDGKSIWFAERCGTNSCANTPDIDTVYHFSPEGYMIKSFGRGLIMFPHGIHVDKDGNIWITDGQDNGAQMAAAAA